MAAPPCRRLPEEVIIWEILVRLPPKPLLRSRAVCRAWRRATSARDFLLAHHRRQPSLQIAGARPVPGSEYSKTRYEDLLAFDHRAGDGQHLQPVARLRESYRPEGSCDGLLLLSKHGATGASYSICNPVTREHAPLGTRWDLRIFSFLGMYLHRPTSEYRLLLHRRTTYSGSSIAGSPLPTGEIGYYTYALGSDQPPRYIEGPDAASELLRSNAPTLVNDSLHWFPVQQHHHHQSEIGTLLLVFDTATESFRRMRAPLVGDESNIFEIHGGTLGLYSYNGTLKVFDVWVLQDYEGEVWEYKCEVKLSVSEITRHLGRGWHAGAFSADGHVLWLASHGGWVFYIGADGKVVESIHRDGQRIRVFDLRLKQTLVPHNFFMTLEGYAVNASPFL